MGGFYSCALHRDKSDGGQDDARARAEDATAGTRVRAVGEQALT
jgi:hypothetical protein